MLHCIKGKKVVGIKQTLKAVKNNECKKVFLAKDARNALISPIEELANERSLEVTYVDTMKELGKICSIDVGASAAAELKDE